MKAVIVETRNKFVAAMTDDGCIVQLRNKNYMIGQVIQMKKITHSYPKIIAGAASIAAVIAISSISVWAYNTPYSYVSLDVNPSIEYSLNRFDRVLSCDAVNDDGEVILDNLDLKNKSIDDAVEETIQEIARNGYLSNAELGGIVIAASSDDEAKALELSDSLKTDAEEATADAGITAEVEVLNIAEERVAEAKELGISPGKLNLVQKLQASNPNEEIVIEDWINQPVKKIMSAIKENKKLGKTTDNRDEDEDAAEETTIASDTSTTNTMTKTTAASVTEQQKEQENKSEKEKEKTTDIKQNENSNKAKVTSTDTVTAVTKITDDIESSDKKNDDSSDVEKEREPEKSDKGNSGDKQDNGKANR